MLHKKNFESQNVTKFTFASASVFFKRSLIDLYRSLGKFKPYKIRVCEVDMQLFKEDMQLFKEDIQLFKEYAT